MTEVATPVMSEDEAERITRRIALVAGSVRESMEKLHALVDEAKRGNAHVALGYRSWTEYLADTLGKQPLRLDRDERREVVGYLSGEGMSTRAIAPIVGVSNKTVHEDRQVLPEVTPEPMPSGPPATPEAFEAEYGMRPDEADALISSGMVADRDEFDQAAIDLSTVDMETGEIREPDPSDGTAVTGRDGKTYPKPTPRPKPEPSKPRRAPLPDAFFKAAYDLEKKVNTLVNLTSDDRFPQNREQVARKHANDLARTAEALTGVLRAINNR